MCTIETKDFIPPGHIYWFNNPIHAPNAFEEGNMANITPQSILKFTSNQAS
jgi:hypothetical protein